MLDFLKAEDAIALVQDALPRIAGRGRTAVAYTMPQSVIDLGAEVVRLGGEACIPIAVGIPKVDGKMDAKVAADVVKLNAAAKALGNTFHFAARSTEDNTTTVWVVAGGKLHKASK